MNQKDITGVNKITTDNLDVNSQIDMKGNKIIGVGDGTSNNDAVNKIQLDAVKTQVATINTNNGYYFFTDQLQHSNENIVKFPANENHYPFNTKIIVHHTFVLHLSGYYHIIYTDFYKGSGNFAIEYTYWPGLKTPDALFTLSLNKQTDWTPITINIIKKIEILLGGKGYSEIAFKIKSGDAIFNGAGYSTFYIKYLHA